MGTIRIPIHDAKRVWIIPADGQEPRQKFVYEGGKRTDKPVVRNGMPVYAFDGAVALDGQPLGIARVESSVKELPKVSFGAVFTGGGDTVLVIAPADQFNLRVTVQTDSVERSAQGKQG